MFGDANSLSNRLFVRVFTKVMHALCLHETVEWNRKPFQKRACLGTSNDRNAKIKNYTNSAESPSLLSPRRRLKEALLAGYFQSNMLLVTCNYILVFIPDQLHIGLCIRLEPERITIVRVNSVNIKIHMIK